MADRPGDGLLAPELRFVELEGVFNFRDLGGLPTRDGASTRAGVMFRSDALHHLSPAAVDQLVELGVQSVIDLRSAVEVDQTGRGHLEHTAIGWFHAPLTEGGNAGANVLPPALAEGDVGRHYVDSLPGRTAMLAKVIAHLADRGNLPAVFHCTAGKDRTGIVAALVLSLVGVPDDVIVHDYTLTDERMVHVMERIRAMSDVLQETSPVAERLMRAEAASMEKFLAAIRGEHGSVLEWAHAAGIADDTITSLRAVLVGDTRQD